MSADAKLPDPDSYALKTAEVGRIDLPDIDCRPPKPGGKPPKIGLIGAGGIVASHLDAYRAAGFEVALICDRNLEKAEARSREFFPGARIVNDWRLVVDDPEIVIADITPHAADRFPIMDAALQAGKHVLSQKPFVLDLDDGEQLVKLAREQGVKLAVNQNGRWSPHMAFMRNAVRAGLIGDVVSVHAGIHWDHGWVAGTPFEAIEHLILSDFGIHWFDFVTSLIGNRAKEVFAALSFAAGQTAKVPLLGEAMIRFDGGQASLVFDGSVPFGARDTSFIAGTKGSIRSEGPDLGNQEITLTTTQGAVTFKPEGQWFNDGFAGAMGELMCAIEENREPENGAAANLESLALAFAAVGAAQSEQPIRVGAVKKLA